VGLKRWYESGGKRLVYGLIGVFAVLAGLWCVMFMVGRVCPTVLELAVPKSLHPAFYWVGLIGKTERVYYDDGGLCYEKHFLPDDTKWLYGSTYDPYGRWVSVSPDGETKYVLHFPDPTGKWVEWYPSGRLHYEENYLDGKRHGVWRGWGENGNLDFEWHYVNDKEHGKQTSYFENGIKGSEVMYENGRIQGMERRWYEDGSLRYERAVRGRERIYKISYAPDGRVAAELRGPNPTGKWVEWYGNGRKSFEGYYLEGERHGKWTSWKADGTVDSVSWYDRGVYDKTPSEELQAWQAEREGGAPGNSADNSQAL